MELKSVLVRLVGIALLLAGIAQLGLITQGWELIGRSRVQVEKASSAGEDRQLECTTTHRPLAYYG